MSMFIVSNDCLNDVANLIIKINPAMDLENVFKKLLELNINIWNDKYNKNENINDYLKKWKIINYNNYKFKDNCGVTRFKDKYYWVQIPQLIESLSCYNYQISEPYHIKSENDKKTYEFIKKLFNNPLISEIIDYINYNGLNDFNNNLVKVKSVEYR